MCCGCCCSCRNRGRDHGYVGPAQQPVTVTAIISQPARAPAPVTIQYPNYPTADSNMPMPQPSREQPPPYRESASAPAYPYPHTVDYPKHSAYNPNY